MSKKIRHIVDQRVGSVLAGKYTIKRVLGVGGMGAVYEAVHTFTDRSVAVKLLHGDFSKMSAVGKRFLQEAKATSTLEHPCILEVLDAGQDADGRLYLVFEHLRGEVLASTLKRQRPPVEDLVRIFAHVLDALAVAHAKGIVHRDIKPGNIFVCEDKAYPERIKLIDFGIARRASQQVGDGLTQAGTILGTPRYMSPEIMLGEPVDPAADLWAMSVMMYLAFTGEPPFEGKNTEALIESMMSTRLATVESLAPDVSPELGWIVIRGLNVERKDRWPSALAMAQRLRAVAPYIEPPAALPQTGPATAELRPLGPIGPIGPIGPQPLPEEDWVPTVAIERKPDWRLALDEIKDEIHDLEHQETKPPEAPKRSGSSLWKRTTSWLGKRKRDDD